MTDRADEDPVLPHYREWLAARTEWERCAQLPGNGNNDWPESLAAKDRENEAREAMTEITPTTMAGIAALVHVLWDWAGPVSTRGSKFFEEECEEEENLLLAAIWRGASGNDGLPPFVGA